MIRKFFSQKPEESCKFCRDGNYNSLSCECPVTDKTSMTPSMGSNVRASSEQWWNKAWCEK